MDRPQRGTGLRRRLRIRSFETRLMLLVTLAVAVPLAIASVVFGRQLERQARDLSSRELAASLETFSLLLEERQASLATGLARMAAVNGLRADLSPGRGLELANFIDVQRQALDVPYVGLFDPGARLLASVVADDEQGLAGLRLEALPGGPAADCLARREVLQAVRCQGTTFLVSALPIYSSAELAGAEGGAATSGQASSALVAWLVGGVPLADVEFAATLQARHLSHPVLWLDGQIVLSDLAHGAIGGPAQLDGTLRTWEIAGTSYLGAARAIALGDQRLAFGVLQPLDALEAARRTALATVVGVGLLLLVGTMAALGVITARVSRPIRRLHEGAAQLAAGVLDHRIELSSGDELEALAAQFNRMAERLQASHADLERTVAERTRQVEEKSRLLEVASRHKSAFLANMSHELRTPMNAIIGYSEILQEDARAQHLDGMVPDLEKIQGAAKHLLGLINGILDLSKIEAGKMELYLEEADLDQLVAEVAATMRPVVARAGNALEVRVPRPLGRAQADVTKIRQCLFNLLGNAAKFTRRSSVVLEAAREPSGGGEAFRFTVIDRGIGMSAAEVGRLFQPFTQADASTTRKFGGTGLGLTITRSFVELMGGTIAVESQPGQGSTFSIHLPARPAEAVASTVTAPGAAVEALATRRPTAGPPGTPAEAAVGPVVLVVDDDPNVRALMERLLRRDGYRPILAEGGAAGLELARRHRPAAITLDVLMPDMDGWCVLAALKADPALSATPVIMLTVADDQKRAFALGAAQFLTKPVDRQRMSRVLRQQVGRAGLPRGLVVDDDPLARRQEREALEREGWVVAEADNGQVALERLESARPHLVLLDLMMPVMDGFEFLEAVRADPAWHDTAVVVVTSKDLSAEERSRLSGSVTRILAKGEHPLEEAIGTLREILAASAPVAPPGEVRLHG